MTGNTIIEREKIFNALNGLKNKPELNLGVDVSQKLFKVSFQDEPCDYLNKEEK